MTAPEFGRPDHGPPHARVLADRYRLDRVLGKGAMGTVWAAFDQLLHRRVAIKEINFPAGMLDSEARMLSERTLREARAIAQLTHPHVITLYDILMIAGSPVIVMEVLAARSLGDVLREHGPLNPGQTATVGSAVASGLAAAHAAGITHRDVKPGNVLISADGRVKLTDFGIARSQSENPMTATGLLLGSPAYISPEVATGQTATPAADAWGLGALLFACVEGRPPYDRGNPIATLMAVVSDPVPPVRRGGPLTNVINALLVKSPTHRMTVQQARAQLVRFADDPTDGRLRIAVAGAASAAARGQNPPGGLSVGGLSAGGPSAGGLSAGGLPPNASMAARSLSHGVPTGASNPHYGPGTQGSNPQSSNPHPAGQLSRPAEVHHSPLDLPPPPWAATGGAHLAALPVSGTSRGLAAAFDADSVKNDRTKRIAIALLVALASAVVGYFGVQAVIDWAGQSSLGN